MTDNTTLGTFYFNDDAAVCKLRGYAVTIDKPDPKEPDTGREHVEIEIAFSASMPRVLEAIRKARLNGNYAPVHVHGVYGRSNFHARGVIAEFEDNGDGFDFVSRLKIHTQLHAFQGPVSQDIPAIATLPPASAPMPQTVPEGWLQTDLHMAGPAAGVADFHAVRDVASGDVIVTMKLTRSRSAVGAIRGSVAMHPRYLAFFKGGWRGTMFSLTKARVLECNEDGTLRCAVAAEGYTGPGLVAN